MEKVVIFCISGQKRAGKDTIANYIREHVIASRISFADPVREVCRAYFGWDDDWLLGEHKEDIDPYWGISPRQAMQYLGTEVGRVGIAEHYPNFDDITGDNIWIKNAQKRIREQHYNGIGKFRAYIIPDMRFLNEYDAMKKMEKEGYKVITIGVERETGLPLDNHVSETEIKYCVEKCDYQLDNNLAISSLHNKIHQLLINIGIEFRPNNQEELNFSWNSND